VILYRQFSPNPIPIFPTHFSPPISSSWDSREPVNELMERRKFFPLDQFELLNEVNEMLERSVKMSLFPQTNHLLEVLVVDVSVHPEQSLQNGLGDRQEVLGERYSDLAREQRLVIQLVLHPSHQVVDVFGSRALDWFLDAVTIRPVVFIFWPRWHYRAAIFCAEFSDGAVEHVDLVEEVDGVDGDPLVDVFAVREHNGGAEIAWAEGGVSVLHQVLLVGTLGYILLGLEGLCRPGAK